MFVITIKKSNYFFITFRILFFFSECFRSNFVEIKEQGGNITFVTRNLSHLRKTFPLSLFIVVPSNFPLDQFSFLLSFFFLSLSLRNDFVQGLSK